MAVHFIVATFVL